MIDLLTKLNKNVSEPKIYAVLVKSRRGAMLHLGVHFTLDDAYAAARARMEAATPIGPGEGVDIDVWNCMTAREAMALIMEPSAITVEMVSTPFSQNPLFNALSEMLKNDTVLKPEDIKEPTQATAAPLDTVSDHLEDLKRARNGLLKSLIDAADSEAVTKLKSPIITAHEKRYVLDRIAEKKLIEGSQTSGPNV